MVLTPSTHTQTAISTATHRAAHGTVCSGSTAECNAELSATRFADFSNRNCTTPIKYVVTLRIGNKVASINRVVNSARCSARNV